MKVHIVCPDWHSDWIIARLVRHLVHGNDWTVGDGPDAGAELNAFFPYLEWVNKGRWTQTPTAAWFTHREEERPGKAMMWDEAAGSIGLRVAPARMYAKGLRGVHIPHPVELDMFAPGSRPRNARPTIGVSGTVYSGGRKGEGLVARLATERADWRIVASGKGWPVDTTWREWADMPAYYRGLDAYLCTALTEGGPVTVLEALACGIRVVVPRGVGQMDELPETAGLRHYTAGDYADMVRAIECVLAERPAPAALRAVVEPYTVRRWCDDWLLAAERYLRPMEGEMRPDWRGHSGVYVVAYGGPARECARRCIDSVHRHMSGVPVALASGEPLGCEDVYLALPDADIGGRSVKTRVYDVTPQEWQYVMYLDADTELVAPVPFLFDVLVDGWDMAICCNPARFHLAANMYRPDNRDEVDATFAEIGTRDIEQLQGGVFSFCRNKATAGLFRAWHTEWQRWGKRDQGALLRAMYKRPVKLYLLPCHWNTSTRYEDGRPTAGIMHYQMEARRHEGVIHGRNDSAEAWAAVKRAGR